MFNSKFNIYSPEWIERVFENRNKSYGAYDLRKNSAANMLRALGITMLALVCVFIVALLFNSKKATSVSIHHGIDVTNKPIYVIPETPIKKIVKPQTTSSKQKQLANSTVERSAVYHPTVNSPDIIPAQSTAQSSATNTPEANKPDLQSTNGNEGAIDNREVSVKPAPIGGAEEWSRFLEINLHYPAEAKQLRISGKVWLSFIVERDGRITNIVVEHTAGHGFDEEAVRVLKMAPLWAAGKQNGQTVRVKYTLPINFHIEHI